MRGPAGDAIIIVFLILFVALVTVKFWYPPLMAWIASIRKDVDKATRDDVESRERHEKRHMGKISHDIADYYRNNDKDSSFLESLSPSERNRLYKERAQRAEDRNKEKR
jgi:NhaP-type Na+/H+ or K+/H+ antiporter